MTPDPLPTAPPAPPPAPPAARRPRPGGRLGVRLAWRRAARRVSSLPPAIKSMLWSMGASMLFALLNALMRSMALQLDPFQAQFLRYLCGALVMAPFFLRGGLADPRGARMGGQMLRGVVHTAGLSLWFLAVPHVPLAVNTAIGFTGPIFVMLGAAMFLHEPVRRDRWFAALAGLAGVAVVVGPRIQDSGGLYALVMLAAAPLFAASFLITKQLTRSQSAQTIVLWQTVSVAVLSLPLACLHWQAPTLPQLGLFAASGVIGSAGNYCLTRAFAVADISASQSVKFLDLVWASLLGWLVFADRPSGSTLIGGAVICGAALLIARREAGMARGRQIA